MNKKIYGLLILINSTCANAGDLQNKTNEQQESCARLITGYTYTKAAQARFHGYSSIAVITEVNGSPVVRGKKHFVLPVGKNTLKVGHVFNDKPKRNNEFTLTAKANTSYYLAYAHNAEWVNGKTEKLDQATYSGPIVVKEKVKSCQK